jgi:hypothetical protein
MLEVATGLFYRLVQKLHHSTTGCILQYIMTSNDHDRLLRIFVPHLCVVLEMNT